MKIAAVGIGYVGLDGTQLQVLHEGLGRFPAAVEAEGNDAAGAVRHVLMFRYSYPFVAFSGMVTNK